MRKGDAEFDLAVDATIELLRETARRSGSDFEALVTYRQLSELLSERGLHVPYHQGPMLHILEEASLRENAAGRAMISALVVQQDGYRPSSGFFRMARRAPFSLTGDDDAIWLDQVRKVRTENQS